MRSSPPRGDERRKNMPASIPISIPSISNIPSNSNSNLNWSLPPSSPLSPLNSHHTASPPTDLPVDIRPGSPTSLLSVPMPPASGDANTRLGPTAGSSLSPLSPTPSTGLSSPETIQFALPSDLEPEEAQSDDHEEEIESEAKRLNWPEGYASDSPSGLKSGQQRRMVPPLLMLSHKRSSSSALEHRPSSIAASASPLATHSRFHSQSSMATFARDSFIDLEDTLEDGAFVNPNAMYPAPPKRNGGLFRHKQSGSIRSIASASSLLPTFADPTGNDTEYQDLAPPSPGLNVPFGGGVVVHAPSTSVPPATSHAWKMFSRDKDRVSRKKDFTWRSNSDESPAYGPNVSSTPSSPTQPSASLKPPKLKHHKKGKSKSHTHPLDDSSTSSPGRALPSSSSHLLPLPIPLPLPPTTNNLDPAVRQDLIKKHRKLAKVLGEEPRVVGHMEFIGASAFIPGKGAGLVSTITTSSSASHHHRGGSASLSASPVPPNTNSLGTFLHLHRKQKGRESDDCESGWEDENKNKVKTGKGRIQDNPSVEAHRRRTHESPRLQQHTNNSTNKVVSALDASYQQALHHVPSPHQYEYDGAGGYLPKRRHSTPVASEFLIDEATGFGEDVECKDKVRGNNKDKDKYEDKRRAKVRNADPPSSRNKDSSNLPDPILISPTSPVPSAPTMRSSKDSILGSPTSDISPSFSAIGDSLSLGDSSELFDGESEVQASATRSPFISPSSSPPPVLPPLTTSPPRLQIDPDIFRRSNTFSSISASVSALPATGVTSSPIIEPITSLHIDTSELREENLKFNPTSTLKSKGTIQEHYNKSPHSQIHIRGIDRNRDPDADSLASPGIFFPASRHHIDPLIIPSAKSPSLSSSRPSTPHSLVNLRDPIPFPTSAPAGPAYPGAFKTSSRKEKEGSKTDLKVTPSNTPISPVPSTPVGVSLTVVTGSGEAVSESRNKDRNKDRTRRTPVGPATFSVPTTPTTASPKQQEIDKVRKIKPCPKYLRTRSESPESFMDFGDDEAENGGSGNVVTGDEKEDIKTAVDVTLTPPVADSEVKASTNASLGISPSTPLSPKPALAIHRTPSMTSLTPSLLSLLSTQTTSTSMDDLHSYNQTTHALLSEQDKRKKMDKLAKLNRFLGDPVPVELVLGESYILKDCDLPAFAVGEGAGTAPGSKRPLWMRRRRSSSSAALPGYEEIDRRKDDLDSKERIRFVRRGAKMEQMFGTRPPPDLYQVHTRVFSQHQGQSVPNPTTNTDDGSITSPVSPSSPISQVKAQSKGNMNSSSYKGKSRYSALGYSTLANSPDASSSSNPVIGGIDYAYANAHLSTSDTYGATASFGRSQSKSKRGKLYTPLPLLFTPGLSSLGFDVDSPPTKRPGSSDSNKPLLAFGQDIPVGGRLRDQANVNSQGSGQLDTDYESLKSSVYMQYRQSLISLGDIVDKDDKASLAELHQYLQLPHSTSHTGFGNPYVLGYEREYDSEESYDENDDDDEVCESGSKNAESRLRSPNALKHDALTTPTQFTPLTSKSPNTPNSAKAEQSLSPHLTRRRSLPSRASTLSLVSTLSGTSTLSSSLSTISTGATTATLSGLANIPGYYNAPRTEAEGRADMFRARRRRAAKLTNFFGVKYRDLFGEVLESIEAGMREDVRVGRMGVGELEELLMRVKKLRLRRGQVN